MSDSVNYKNENINHKLFRYTFARELSMEGHCRKDIEITKLEFQMSANYHPEQHFQGCRQKIDRTPISSEHLAHEVKGEVETFRLYKQHDGLHVRVQLLHKPIV
jgi:hypothetical protein